MAAWPSNPDWTDLSNINKGNEYVGGDGIYYSDLNAIVKNLLVIKKQLDMLSYSIDITATHCVPDPQNPTKIIFAGTSTLKFTAETGYTLPSTVSITGATSTWTIFNGVGTLTLKDPTSNITGSIVATIITYSISYSATHINPSTSNPSTIAYGGSASLTFTLPTGYVSPQNKDDITVSGATLSAYYRLSDTKCTLTIANPTGNVLVTIAGVARTYTITANIYNGTADSSNPHTITYGQSATLIYTANAGYKLPNSVSVTGASYTWEPTTGVLDLSDPNTNVIIRISCVQDTATVTYNLTHCTAASTNPTTVTIGGSADFKFVAATGYELSATPTVTGATLASWDYPVADDKTTMIAGIENVTGNVTISVVASQPKLAAPTNLSVSDDTLSFDEVANAEQYEVFAGSNSIGTYSPTPAGYTLEVGVYKWADMLSKLPVDEIDFDIIFVSGSTTYSNINISLDTNMEYTDTVSYFSESEGDPLVVYIASDDEKWSAVNAVYQTITISTSQTVSAEFYTWAITGGNLVKQTNGGSSGGNIQ